MRMIELLKNTIFHISFGHLKIKMAIYCAGLMLCIFINSVLITTLISSYYEKVETEQQITAMQTFLDEWHRKNNDLNDAPMRPVAPDKADQVQTDIIFRLQAFKVNIQSIKELKQGSQETNGKVYAMEFSGPYENTMKCIKSLQDSGALVGFKHFQLASRDGAINAKLTYKIYTK